MSGRRKTDREKYASAVWRQGEPRRAAERERLLATGVPVPERVSMALDLCGLYGPEVDAACGGEDPMVDEWESGTRVPTVEEIVLLANLTGFSAEFFYKPAPPPLSGGWLCGEDGCEPLAGPGASA